MATVTNSELLHSLGHRNIRVFKWTGVNASDECVPVVTGAYNDKTVYFIKDGTGFGGSMSLVGSPHPDFLNNTGTATFVTLSDPQGNTISAKTSNTVEAILEHAYLIKPIAGSGVAAVDVYLVLASAK